MTHPWPATENEFLLNDALDIAMRYFDLPPDSAEYASVEKFAADAIMDEWKLGVRHKIVLATRLLLWSKTVIHWPTSYGGLAKRVSQ